MSWDQERVDLENRAFAFNWSVGGVLR